jgi:hypothetical protein
VVVQLPPRSGRGDGGDTERVVLERRWPNGVRRPAVRQQVIEILAGYPSPETLALRSAAGAGSRRTARRDGPRCPGCQRRLDGHVGYRILPIQPIGDGSAPEPGRTAEPL